jgi:hypothetical protein
MGGVNGAAGSDAITERVTGIIGSKLNWGSCPLREGFSSTMESWRISLAANR